jgi:hypothetical protein
MRVALIFQVVAPAAGEEPEDCPGRWDRITARAARASRHGTPVRYATRAQPFRTKIVFDSDSP